MEHSHNKNGTSSFDGALESKDVLLWQTNLQKSKAASSSLWQSLAELHTPSLIFLQEPNVFKGKLVGMNANNNSYHFSSGRFRAAIVGSPTMDLWMCDKFTDNDFVTCIWRTGRQDFPEIYVVSAYCDITCMQVPDMWTKLCDHARKEHKQVMICSDTNAHSSLWGSIYNNRRGDFFDEFILLQGLIVMNTGENPTWRRGGQSSIIDVMFVTPGLEDLILGWHVNQEEDSLSDHYRLEAKFQISSSPTFTRKWKNGLWSLFQDKMEERTWLPLDPWTPRWLDKEVDIFEHELKQALDEACPLVEQSGRFRQASWWSDDLTTARSKARVAHHAWLRQKTEEVKNHWRDARNSYKKLMHKAKKLSWRKFVTGIMDSKGMSFVFKALQRRDNKSLGILNNADGTSTDTPEASLNLLFAEHFPGSRRMDPVVPGEMPESLPNTSCTSFELLEMEMITPEKIRRAFASFSNYKAAGKDGFKPIMLKQLGPKALQRLTWLYKASIQLEYVPRSWRESKVIFIPKPGKSDYSQVRAFRPISLTSFLFKGLERMVLWDLEEHTFKSNPLHQNQHAFRPGFSCDSALTDMVDDVEAGILRDEFALGVFLDIEGAFDNLSLAAAIEGMRSHNFPPKIVGWFGHYLTNRKATASVKGVTSSRTLTKGTPQGGVLSPVIWNTAFDSFLKLFDNGPVRAKGFADDGGLVIRGKDPATLMSYMQEAVDRALEWGRSKSLKFSAKKTVVVLFTRKYKYKFPQKLIIEGKEVAFSDSAKYLGITLDSKLNWNAHIGEKVKKAKGLLMRLKGIVGKQWGSSPALVKWVYTGIVRPMITYGCLVWGHRVDLKQWHDKLMGLNRLAVLSIAPVRKNTPTAALEIMYDLIPLDLFIAGEALKAWRRTEPNAPGRWDGLTQSNVVGHRRHWMKKAGKLDLVHFPSDKIVREICWTKGFWVDRDSFENGTPGDLSGLVCFTDGSKINGAVGFGFAIYRNDKEILRDGDHLGKFPSVFQSEICAISAACLELAEISATSVTFYSDSQAAIMALDNHEVRSQTVKDCIQDLNRLSRTKAITIRWVKAHIGHKGNELADTMAKEGAGFSIVGMEPYLPLPDSSWKGEVLDSTRHKWGKRWNARWDCRQTKLWYPGPEVRKAKHFMQLGREELGLCAQFITGHNFMARHTTLLGETRNGWCRLCLNEEEPETAWHVAAECPTVRNHRVDIFLAHLMSPCPSWSVAQLSRFISVDCIGLLMIRSTGLE